MLQSGFTLTQALTILQEQESKTLIKKTLNHIKHLINCGYPLHKAVIAHLPLNSTYINLITLGEHTGKLEQVLFMIASYEKKQINLKQNIIKTIYYPTLILVTTIVSLGFIVFFVIPKFAKIYQEFKMEMPGITTFMINLANFTIDNLYFIIIFIGAGMIITVIIPTTIIRRPISWNVRKCDNHTKLIGS